MEEMAAQPSMGFADGRAAVVAGAAQSLAQAVRDCAADMRSVIVSSLLSHDIN